MTKKVLITGGYGFTGRHLKNFLLKKNFDVYCLESNIIANKKVNDEVNLIKPDYVIHLAGISNSTIDNEELYTKVNVEGTVNLINALNSMPQKPKKVLIASSASVYGNPKKLPLTEVSDINPVNLYGESKLEMENRVNVLEKNFPVIFYRLFNYTGVFHDRHFLIPKVVDTFKRKLAEIELGNINIKREFNDVRDICEAYYLGLIKKTECNIINICSGKSFSISEIMKIMSDLSAHHCIVKCNEKYLRRSDPDDIYGDNEFMQTMLGSKFKHNIKETLSWMYHAK
ncbi:MAG: epimerase [Gammaproteobacteria bacterium]|nr:epimerase [Gammaproteobacteria bacterium]|tara:strand:- start:3229 stop:4083 length:855 start_codon:yes stop_codon:yes gene_type:complete